MKINASTDYAIRILIYLAEKKRTISSSELSRELSVSKRYLLSILAKLRDGGIVTVAMGSEGGYKLTVNPKEISLFDIIEFMEGTAPLATFFLEPDSAIHVHNALASVYHMLQQFSDHFLKQVSIELMLHKTGKDIQALLLEMLKMQIDTAAVSSAACLAMPG